MSPDTLKIIIEAAKKATNGDQEKWRRVMLYAMKNGTEGLRICMEALDRTGTLLNEGKSPEQAYEAIRDAGLTTFERGAVLQLLEYFHPRGGEMMRCLDIHI